MSRAIPSSDHRTTEVRYFEQECRDPRTLAILMDHFQKAFHPELEEIQSLKKWAHEQADALGIPVEIILADAGREYAGIIAKTKFFSERRKELESEMERRRGGANTLETVALSHDPDERIFQEPEYMALLNDDLSDASHYFSTQAKRAARMNRDKADRALDVVRKAEAESIAHRGRR